MGASKNSLLDFFIICNIPSSNKFYLFCRNLLFDDLGMSGLFDDIDYEEKYQEKYPVPQEYCADEFYDKAHWEYFSIKGAYLVGGLQFGAFNSYEEALESAKSYTAKKLLDTFFRIYKKAVKAKEKEDKEFEEFKP